MKKLATRLILSTVGMSALFAMTSCTTPDTGDGTTSGFYGPSTANTSDYTDRMRSEYRNNW